MTRSFRSLSLVVLTGAGTTVTHGLTHNGVAVAPDTWHFNERGPTSGVVTDGRTWMTALPGTANFILQTSGATGLVDVWARTTMTIFR